MKLLCLYQVMFHYRVGTYQAISKLDGVDFELWHGSDVPNTKLKNYRGDVSFRHRQIPCIHLHVKTNNGSSSQPFFPFLFFRLIRYSPDVIFAEGASSIFSLSVAYLYSKLFNKRIIMWSMGKLAGRKHHGIRGLLQKWIRRIEKGSNALFVYSSQAEGFFIQEGVEPKRIFKAINVIDTNSKLESLKEAGHIEKDPGFNVVFVGAINKTKRLELLVDAIDAMEKSRDDLKLHIIGDGNYLQTIKNYVVSKKLEDIVVFHGRVTEGLNALLARYQVLALPGLGGLAIVDGMVSSLPIISGLADGTELDLIDERNGFVTDSMTVEYLTDKLRVLKENPELAREMGECSFAKITGEFSFDSYINHFNNCLNFVMNEK
jgi:glycosyltransferase involved in cell wall biosynthesis